MNDAASASEGLVVRGLSKTFPGQVALAGVGLRLRAGEVHALLGQNGSGKSTLIKILAGVYQPDPGGTVTVNGASLALGSAVAAHHAGLRFIHQDLGLVPTLDVVDNLALGQRYQARWWLSARREAAAARELLADLDAGIDVGALVGRLSAAERTIVAVARAVRGGVSSSGVLVLDEPTASLPAAETGRLFRLVRTVAERGTAVLYVTHRISEVFALADRVTVLRDGHAVLSAPVGEVSHDLLVEHIVGRPIEEFYPQVPVPGADIALAVRDLATARLRELSFAVHRGEIVGVAGISGSGREDVAPALAGAIPWAGGQMTLGERVIGRLDPAVAISLGIAYLPHDRKRESAIPAFTVRENLTLPRLRTTRGGWLSLRQERADAECWLDRLAVRPADAERVFATLSGGNQQKVVLARWMRCGATAFVLDEPTQGVDVGAKSMIYQSLTEAARQGAAVIVASSDNEELARLCDRVIVLHDGRAGAELHGSALTADSIARQALAAAVPA
ncbi:MAG TPA: sugar ABC transporter ATP-binding protein [Streptosporangiaceae bacterium]|nr:sugar ABC transporter ATP-binding protein [Streptosporangiaceae bacterium]